MSNILVAFANLVGKTQLALSSDSISHNRANQMGESLETYIKDLFCDSFGLSVADKLVEYTNHFSYFSKQNNPPDIMLRGGDAIEVKKIESADAALTLNSSHPKDVLHADDPKISRACRGAEEWTQKDIIYAVGHAKTNELKRIWFVYGDCYAASRDTYTQLSDMIAAGIRDISDIEFGTTKELARVNEVDPLGITHLRVRGMWGISNPAKVYDYLPEAQGKFANLLLRKSKYISFPIEDRARIESLQGDALSIQEVKIKDPNNPALLLDAVLLSYRLVS